jgi:hypothetical protein
MLMPQEDSRKFYLLADEITWTLGWQLWGRRSSLGYAAPARFPSARGGPRRCGLVLFAGARAGGRAGWAPWSGSVARSPNRAQTRLAPKAAAKQHRR